MITPESAEAADLVAATPPPGAKASPDREAAVALLDFLCRPDPDRRRVESFLESAGTIGWERMAAAARAASLSPLLHRSLKDSVPETDPPAEVLKRLRGDFMLSAIRAVRTEQALLPLLADCAAEGLPVILLKGICLVATVYGDAALRPMGDVDILVEVKNIPRANNLLAKHGYAAEAGQEGMMADHLAPYFAKNRIPIELHFTIMNEATHPGLDMDTGGLFSRAHPVKFRTASAWIMATEDQVVHLCDHMAAHHLFAKGLRGLVDIARTIAAAGESFGWDIFIARAKAWSAERSCALSITLCERYAGLALPARVGEWTLSICEIRKQISLAEDALFGAAPGIHLNMVRLSASGSIAGRMRFLLGIAFPAPGTMRNIMAGGAELRGPVGNWLPSLYARRFVHLWKTHSARAWRIVSAKGDSRDAQEGGSGHIALDDWLRMR